MDSRLVEAALPVGAALLGALVAGPARWGGVFGIVASTGGKRGPARRNGQEIVTDLHLPIDRVALFSI